MLAVLLVSISLALAAFGAGATPAPAGSAGPPALSVSGNRLVDANGNTVRLLGVNRVSPEYACTFGEIGSGPEPGFPGYNPLTPADAATIAAWHPTAVRVPLNEDCWLGQNGMPTQGLGAGTYREAIVRYVGYLHAQGLYAILDLHWSNPLNLPSGEGLHPMPDQQAPAFWKSVAEAFAGDGAVVFDAFNEPYDPATHGDPSHPVSWNCWRDGGCSVPAAPDTQPPNPGQTYTAAGMQQIVSAIRSTGSRQPIMLGGLEYANDLSGWLAHEPTDPAGALVASFHNYTGQECDDEACWSKTIAPVAAAVPVVTGEFGETDCPPSGTDPSNFDNTYMRWADTHGVGYLGWGWVIPDPPRTCATPYLISDYIKGTPVDPNGVALHDHLAQLWAASQATPAGPGAVAPAPASAGAGSSQESRRLTVALAGFLRRAGKPPSAAELLRAGGWKAKFAAPGAGLFVARWERRGGKPIARARRQFKRASTATIWLRLTQTGRRALARHPHLSAQLDVSFLSSTGTSEVSSARVSPAPRQVQLTSGSEVLLRSFPNPGQRRQGQLRSRCRE
jgi:endoglucanase